MYKGTLIKDLAELVERAEQGAQQKRIVEPRELPYMFALQIPQMQHSERMYAGAA